MNRTSDAYRRFRNTYRFILGNLSDFDDRTDAVRDFNDLLPADQWALVRLARLLDEIDENYDAYLFHRVYRAVYDYVVGDLSAVYMDELKDRLYSEAPDSHARRSAQTVLFNILEVLVRVMVPILTFTTEEVWQHYPEAMRNREDREISVQLAGWPSKDAFVPALPADAESIAARFDAVLEAREAVTKALEEARTAGTIGKSQEAEVAVAAPAAALEALNSFDADFYREFFIVADATFTVAEGDEYAVDVKKTELDRCPRCWNHRALGGNAHHPDVCERCGDALDAIGFAAEE